MGSQICVHAVHASNATAQGDGLTIHHPLDHPCAGPDRALFLPGGLLDRDDLPAYLNGELPGE